MKITPKLERFVRKFCVFVLWLVLTGFLVGIHPIHGACAESADSIAKQAEDIIRSAERDMFAGKSDQADQKLNEAAELIESLKVQDPENKKLKSLESRFGMIRKNVDKRMGKTVVVPSQTSSPASTKMEVKSAPPSGSSEAKRRQAVVDRAVEKAVKDVDYALKKIDDLIARDESSLAMPTPADQKTGKAKRYIEEAERYLSQTEKKYADQLPSPNPDFEHARVRIAEAEKKVEAWGKSLAEQADQDLAMKVEAEAKHRDALAQAKADADRMTTLYDKYYANFDAMTGNSLVYGIKYEDAQKALEQIEQAERLFPEFSSEMGSLAEMYGTNSMAISNKLFEMGYKESGSAGNKFALLIDAAGKIGATRKESADSVARNAETLLSAFSNQLTDARIQRMNDVKALLLIGQEIDAENAKIRDMLGKIDDQIAETADKMEKQINATTWAGDIKDFPGPGKAEDLAKAALEYFRNDRDWGKKTGRNIEVLSVCVRGPWKVAERDVFGRTIQWRLPIHVAVTDEKLRPRNLARVYDLSIVAMEGAPDNSPRQPPYDGYWVGESWMMRLDKF